MYGQHALEPLGLCTLTVMDGLTSCTVEFGISSLKLDTDDVVSYTTHNCILDKAKGVL